jgi:protease-4
MSEQNQNWERGVLERLATDALKEQKRARHWGILFKSLTFIYLFILLFVAAGWFKGESTLTGRHTALVNLKGVISANDESADKIIQGLQDAFDDSHTAGVVLRINSPGGSPVQAGEIYDEIKRLRTLHPKIPLYVVVDDICASGGYYVASAADKIFVDKASIVGSIGVLMDGFGFTGTMQKLGVQRRLLTAGKNKGFLDPFSPEDPAQVAYARKLLEEIHQQFIHAVETGRGKRLKETPDMFSGLFWSGADSIKLGLADGYGSLNYVARDVIKAKDIVDYTPQENLASRLAGKLGMSIGKWLNPLTQQGVELH